MRYWIHRGAIATMLLVGASACGGEVEAEGSGMLESRLSKVDEARDAVDRINERSDPEAYLAREAARDEAPAPAPERPVTVRRTSIPAAAPAQPEPDPTGRIIATEPDGNTAPDIRPADDVSASAPITIPAGVEIELRMAEEVSTKSAEVGGVVWATVANEVLAPSGMVLVPEGTRARAVIVESRESPDDDTPAILILDFEALMLPDGETAIRSRVLEADVQADERDSDTETAGKVAAGAAVGAVLGKILGGSNEDAAKAGAVGAAAGAAVAIGTRAGHAKLDEGARIVIRVMDSVPLVS